jgi:hypothetical protein
MSKKFKLDKKVTAILAQIGAELKNYEADLAVSGVLFAKQGDSDKTICGCAFPQPDDEGCSASGNVSKRQLNKVIAKIYTHGYVPVGMVMISPVNEDNGVGSAYGSTLKDRHYSFVYLHKACEPYEGDDMILVVVDDVNRLYHALNKDRDILRCYNGGKLIESKQLVESKGGAVWISQDSSISSILERLGVKLLR